jgi:hypothetical protein
MAGTPRIYVDLLNTGGRANQVVLDTAGTLSDLERHGIVLREDLVLHLYSDDADESGQRDDLIVEGVVHFDEQNGRWLAIYDPAAFMHESDQGRGVDGSTLRERSSSESSSRRSHSVGGLRQFGLRVNAFSPSSASIPDVVSE